MPGPSPLVTQTPCHLVAMPSGSATDSARAALERSPVLSSTRTTVSLPAQVAQHRAEADSQRARPDAVFFVKGHRVVQPRPQPLRHLGFATGRIIASVLSSFAATQTRSSACNHDPGRACSHVVNGRDDVALRGDPGHTVAARARDPDSLRGMLARLIGVARNDPGRLRPAPEGSDPPHWSTGVQSRGGARAAVRSPKKTGTSRDAAGRGIHRDLRHSAAVRRKPQDGTFSIAFIDRQPRRLRRP